MSKKRLLLLVGVLALVPATFLTAGLTSRRSRTADIRQRAVTGEAALTASLALTSPQATYRVGEEFIVEIRLDTGGALVSAGQVRVGYNPAVLQILEVIPGRNISQEPAMLAEVLKSEVRENEPTIYLDQAVSLPGPQAYKNQDPAHLGIYGRLRVKALAEGPTSLNFKFAHEPRFAPQAKGDTDILTLQQGAATDLLARVQDLSLTIRSAGEPPPPPPPPPPPTPVCELNMRQEAGVGKSGLGPSFEYVAFTPSVSGRLEKVAIKAGTYGVGERSVICKITDKDKRDLSPEAASAIFQGGGEEWREVRFDSVNLQLLANTPYYLACRANVAWKGVYWVLDWTKGRTYRISICH